MAAQPVHNDLDLGPTGTGTGAVPHAVRNFLADPQAVAPSSPAPLEGQLWYDTANNQLKAHDGSGFAQVGEVGIGGSGILKTGVTYDVELVGTRDNNAVDGLDFDAAGVSGKLGIDPAIVPRLASQNTFTGATQSIRNDNAQLLIENTAGTDIGAVEVVPASSNMRLRSIANHLLITSAQDMTLTATLNATITAANGITLNPGTSTDAGSKKIVNLLDPTAAQDAATKAYVDATAAGLDVKQSVRLATTSANSFTVASGHVTVISGTSVDGVTGQVGDRILVKDAPAATGAGSANSSQPGNGIYTVTNATTNLTLARATDADAGTELSGGTFTFVESGTANADTGWIIVTDDSAIVPGTDVNQWTQFTGAGQITADAGLIKTGNSIAAEITGGATTNSAQGLAFSAAGAGGTIGIDTTIVPRLGVSNTFTAKQIINSASGLEIQSAAVAQGALDVSGTTVRLRSINSNDILINAAIGLTLQSVSSITLTTSGSIDITGSKKITGLGDATAAQDAMNRQASDARYPRKASFNVGNAAATSFALAHNFALANANDVIVQIRKVSNGRIQDVDNVATDANTVTVTWDGYVPGSNEFRATVMA